MNNTHVLFYTSIPELGEPHKGKVRDIYDCGDTLVMIATDRLSFFNRILNEPIKNKGKVLTGVSRFWFENTKDITHNHFLYQPDPNVLVVKKCRPLLVEVVVRAYLTGSIFRDYSAGKRKKCGISLPEGLKKNDPLPHPIITPATKDLKGHDEDISREELVQRGIVSQEQWEQLESISYKLFARGCEILRKKGIILVDTKYEFGLDKEGKIILIDEIHTPDSSRFWFEDDPKGCYYDKEFAREWAMQQGFMGHGPIPTLTDEVREKIGNGYKKLYEAITDEKLPEVKEHILERVRCNLKKEIKAMQVIR